jgi:hypothetical protein
MKLIWLHYFRLSTLAVIQLTQRVYLSSGLSHIYPWIECQLRQSLAIGETLIEMDMVLGGNCRRIRPFWSTNYTRQGYWSAKRGLACESLRTHQCTRLSLAVCFVACSIRVVPDSRAVCGEILVFPSWCDPHLFSLVSSRLVVLIGTWDLLIGVHLPNILIYFVILLLCHEGTAMSKSWSYGRGWNLPWWSPW